MATAARSRIGVAEAERYRGFAVPHQPFDFRLLENLTVEHYRRVIRGFVSRFGAAVERHSDGVIPFLQSRMAGSIDFEMVWDPSFGKIRELLCPPGDPTDEGVLAVPSLEDDEVVERVAGLMLRLCETGASGHFGMTFLRPARLRWGRWQLPIADSLTVDCDGQHATVCIGYSDDSTRLSFEKHGETWITEGASGLPVLVWNGRSILINPTEDPALVLCGGHLPITAETLGPAITQFEAALDILQRHAPVYGPWVDRVLRQLVPSSPAIPNDMVSGSFVHRPGVVMLSSPMSVVIAAELIAHEACHQHFWLMVQAGAVDDGTDRDKRHFSPYVSAMRNLRMMLMTYHAFGNAVLFHRACRAGGLVRDESFERERQFTRLFAPYEQLLAQSEALTPLGRKLWETVAEQLHGSAARGLPEAEIPAAISD